MAFKVKQSKKKESYLTLRVYKVNAGDVFDDDNKGYKYGLEEEEMGGYIEWFKTKEGRDKAIRENKMKVLN